MQLAYEILRRKKLEVTIAPRKGIFFFKIKWFDSFRWKSIADKYLALQDRLKDSDVSVFYIYMKYVQKVSRLNLDLPREKWRKI